jgi:O-antigen biosynthesis protein WbqP
MTTRLYPLAKRAFDTLASLAALAVLGGPMLLIAAIIRLSSPGPALHWSKRIGKNNTLFNMAKFRSMRIDTPQVATHLMKNPEQYVTPIGRFLRKYSLDELPQLFNILRGDISVVGPRPALYNQDDLIELRTKAGVHAIIPGLTGWAQVNGRDELPIPIKVRHDAHYLRHRSFCFDLRIIWITVKQVFSSAGVSH